MSEPTWTAVVPIKRLDAAKRRLRGALADVPHAELALALARDTVEAVLACRAVTEVLVVTDDPRVARAVRAAGARVVPDPGAGLNPAFARGAEAAGAVHVAALTADLPALRPAELAAALGAAEEGPSRRFVADAPGTGTVLLAARAAALDPRFGPDSAAAHAASGALPLAGAWPSLRRDVDTPADLAAAVALGVGPHTAALTAAPRAAATAR